ncbi:MAG: TolC family outer membrane protein, partial [Gammaproteobacteria bacterium]
FYENEIGKENKNLGRAGLLPNVGINYQAQRNRSDLTNEIGGKDLVTHPEYISRSAGITLRQPLLNMEAIARYRQGKVQTEQSAAQFDTRGAEMIVRVAGAYLDVLLAEDTLTLARAQRDTFAEQAKVNQRMFEKGEGTRTDMLETAARLDQAEAAVLEAQDTVTVNRNTLEGLIKMEPGHLQRLGTPYRPPQLKPASFEEWRAIALANNSDIRAATLAAEVARLEIDRARAGHLPRVDFIATYSKSTADTVNTYTQTNLNRALGVQVNVPLYSGGQVSAGTRQAVAGYGRAKADLEARSDRVLVDLRKAHTAAVSSVARVAALEKAVESAQLLTRATEQSIKGGVRINLDLLTAQQQLSNVQRDLAQARYNNLMALLRLRAAAGTLTSSDLHEISGYFK